MRNSEKSRNTLLKCSKDFHPCRSASYRTDDKGYPFGLECRNHGEFVELIDAGKEKLFVSPD